MRLLGNGIAVLVYVACICVEGAVGERRESWFLHEKHERYYT